MILNQNKNHDFDSQNHVLIFKIKIKPISGSKSHCLKLRSNLENLEEESHLDHTCHT